MASYKVTIENGFPYKGKTYAKGDSINLPKQAAESYLRLDYIKEEGAKAPAKAAAKKGAAKKQSTKADTDVNTIEPVVK